MHHAAASEIALQAPDLALDERATFILLGLLPDLLLGHAHILHELAFLPHQIDKAEHQKQATRLPKDVLESSTDLSQPAIQAHERESEKQIGVLPGDGNYHQ